VTGLRGRGCSRLPPRVWAVCGLLAATACSSATGGAHSSRAAMASDDHCRAYVTDSSNWRITCDDAVAHAADVEMEKDDLDAAWSSVVGSFSPGAQVDALRCDWCGLNFRKGPVRIHSQDQNGAADRTTTAAVIEVSQGRFRSIACVARPGRQAKCDSLIRTMSLVPWGGSALVGASDGRRAEAKSLVVKDVPLDCYAEFDGAFGMLSCRNDISLLWIEVPTPEELELWEDRVMRVLSATRRIEHRGAEPCEVLGSVGQCTVLRFAPGDEEAVISNGTVAGRAVWAACLRRTADRGASSRCWTLLRGP
jgi:hypothetical protein